MGNHSGCLGSKGIAGLLVHPAFWIALAVVFLAYMLVSVYGSPSGGSLGKPEVLCDVTVNGNWLGGVDLQRVSCSYSGEKCFSFSSLSIFNPFSKEGEISVVMGDGASAAKDYSVYVTGGDEETYRLKLCTVSGSGKVSVVNDEGRLEDEGDFLVK